MSSTLNATYNGWSNRETWLASLWLTNDESSYALLKDAIASGDSDFARADWLERRLREQLAEEGGDASMWCDLLNTAFHRIDWVEVIENNQN